MVTHTSCFQDTLWIHTNALEVRQALLSHKVLPQFTFFHSEMLSTFPFFPSGLSSSVTQYQSYLSAFPCTWTHFHSMGYHTDYPYLSKIRTFFFTSCPYLSKIRTFFTSSKQATNNPTFIVIHSTKNDNPCTVTVVASNFLHHDSSLHHSLPTYFCPKIPCGKKKPS